MVEAAAAGKEGQPMGVPTAEENKNLKALHAKFWTEYKKKQQEVVMKFKRSNDAVLCVYVPDSFNGQGCISCSADHNARCKFWQFSFSILTNSCIKNLKDP